ncbi:MAG: hypothetical protein IPH42_10955 [Bacteroidetes bacterium]|nr:hypothetical protein [Bacteroidota bacterium]
MIIFLLVLGWCLLLTWLLYVIDTNEAGNTLITILVTIFYWGIVFGALKMNND